MDRDPEVQALIDKQEINDLITRYCRAADRRDRKLLESLYWPDGTDDHGLYVGNVSGFVDFAMKALDGYMTQHFIGNVLIEMDSPTTANAETYVIALHQGKTPTSGEEFIVGARYLDRLEKRNNEWRFKARTLAFDYTRSTSSTPTSRYDGMQWKGASIPDDPIYRLFS